MIREVVRSRRGLYEVLSRALSDFLKRYSPRKALLNSIIKALGSVRVHGIEVSLNWGRDRPLLTELFREFDGVSGSVDVGFVIVIDEAQRLGGSLGIEVWSAVAHAYDFLGNIKFIISGSEVVS
ncbi:ATP-binding protein [Vulcanisaeta sp. JCM 16159]|uniref:ATP-binding protein n=1 Tax=Vulcanisaeta sp. JCM 16159 TaxID=1295371 RepID=UPI0006CF7BC9|nr:ATP-binding protein [Vulcanisaeta sp. JCM 16159]